MPDMPETTAETVEATAAQQDTANAPDEKAGQAKRDPVEEAVSTVAGDSAADSAAKSGGPAPKEKRPTRLEDLPEEARVIAEDVLRRERDRIISKYHEDLKRRGLLVEGDPDSSGDAPSETTDRSSKPDLDTAAIEERLRAEMKAEMDRREAQARNAELVRANLLAVIKENQLDDEAQRKLVAFVQDPEKNGGLYEPRDFLTLPSLRAAARAAGLASGVTQTPGPQTGSPLGGDGMTVHGTKAKDGSVINIEESSRSAVEKMLRSSGQIQ